MFRFQDHWIVTIKGRHKKHFTYSDEDGCPLTTTLCGIAYSVADRTRAERGKTLAYDECRACWKVLSGALAAVAEVQRIGGATAADASAFAAELLKLKIDC